MKNLLCLLLLLAGCSGGSAGSPDQFSREDAEKIKPGLTIAETEAILGKDYTTITAIREMKVCQWTRGAEADVSSIVVTFQNDKVQEVASSNLK